MSENEGATVDEKGNHLDSPDATPKDGDAVDETKSGANGEACTLARENSSVSIGGEAETETATQKLPAKPSLKSSNSNHQLTKSNSQYRVHFPEQEVTKIVETEIIVVPSCTQRVFYQMFCCCSRPYKP